jgi:hypothetical protein
VFASISRHLLPPGPLPAGILGGRMYLSQLSDFWGPPHFAIQRTGWVGVQGGVIVAAVIRIR